MKFTQVEYLTVFSSIIFGFTAAEYFHGWGSLRNLRKFHFKFLLWTILGMFYLVDIWWGSWVRVSHLADNIGSFYLSLSTPLILYLIAVVSFPESKVIPEINTNMYFSKRFGKIMFLYFLSIISIIANAIFFDPNIFDSPKLTILYITAFLTFIGIFVTSNKGQLAVLIIGYLLIFCHLIFFKDNIKVDIIENYTQEEYLNIFMAIVYGYVASVFFTGWGRLLRNFKWSEIHIYHLFWTIFAFLIFVDIWWSTWGKMDQIPDSIYNFFLILVQPFVYYFLAIMLFSVLEDKKENLHEKFRLASPSIFILFCLIFLCNITLSTFFNELPLFHSKNILRFLGIVFGFIAIFKHSKVYQISILTTAYLLYFVHLFVDEVLK
ncbi:MAG: hypothetical protein OEW75_02695 [Cyclobacteriaceae bacterium]|nr:hypothetical protein [Cyclobacteriaceae bacterium]